MSRSVLLQLARDSIQEVLEAQNSIDKASLLIEHPLLEQNIPLSVRIYINNELRGHSESLNPKYSLLQEIIINAKKAAFEDPNFSPLSTSEYLHLEIEITLHTTEGIMSEKDPAILQ